MYIHITYESSFHLWIWDTAGAWHIELLFQVFQNNNDNKTIKKKGTKNYLKNTFLIFTTLLPVTF